VFQRGVAVQREWLQRRWLKPWAIAIILVLSIGLSGCVEADSSIQYQDQVHGTLVQHLHLDTTPNRIERFTAERWLQSVRDRTLQLDGSVEQHNDQDWILSIPFYNGADLQHKFNQLMQQILFSDRLSNSPEAATPLADSLAGAPLPADLTLNFVVHEQNFGLVQRNHITYALDLRSQQSNQDVWLPLQNAVTWTFSLATPWGATPTPNSDDPIQPTSHQLIWQLHPERPNYIDVEFWLPSPLGIAAAGIGVLVALGWTITAAITRRAQRRAR
jgi:hypothetical protein